MPTILLVDDDDINRVTLTTLLGRRGYDLLEASGGDEGLELARAAKPDLVISDILMPSMDGFEFVRRLRADPAIAHIPVLFYSATYLEREAEALARDIGVDRILAKPAQPKELLGAIAAALGRAGEAHSVAAPDTFARDHTRLLTDKLAGKVQELELANRRLGALVDAGRRMASERDMQRLLQDCCDAARAIIGAKYAVLGIDEDAPGSGLCVTSGVEPAENGGSPPAGELFGQLYGNGSRMSAGLHPQAFLGAPIVTPARAYGWLYLAGKLDAEAFDGEDEQLLGMLAAELAIAYENGRRYEDLERHAAALEREMAERRLVERERDQLLIQERAARSAAEAAQKRQAMQIAVTRILAESDTRYEAVPLLLETIGIGAGCDLGELWRADSQAALLRWENAWCAPSFEAADFEAASQTTTIPAGSGLCGQVWASMQPAWAADIADEPAFPRAAAIGAGLHAAFAFPIRGSAAALGVIAFFCREPRAPDLALLTVLADIGSQIGQFFERVQAEERLRQYTQRLRVLHAIDQAILALQTPEAIAQAALRHIRQLVPCQRASVTAFDFDLGEAIALAVDVGAPTRWPNGTRYAIEHVLDLEALRRGEPVVIADARDHLVRLPALREGLQEDLRSILSVPLISQGALIGTLNLSADRPGAFTPEYIDIAREVGDQLTVAIQNTRLFEQVRVGRERLQSLSRQLVSAQEDERRHLARELHDEIGQSLTAAQLNLQALQALPDPRELPARLEDCMALIEQVLQQVRALSLDLRPSMLDDLGLVPALRWYLNRQAERAGFTAHFVADTCAARFAPEIETACFRIAQETLTNVVRHAQARHVHVELHCTGAGETRDAALRLTIQDDGVGFDVAAARERATNGASMGLLGMQERALLVGGQLTFESQPGQGSTVLARFPFFDTAGAPATLERRKARR